LVIRLSFFFLAFVNYMTSFEFCKRELVESDSLVCDE
jgi:hypothetical protein